MPGTILAVQQRGLDYFWPDHVTAGRSFEEAKAMIIRTEEKVDRSIWIWIGLFEMRNSSGNS